MQDYREKVRMMAYRGHRGAHTSAEATGNLWCPCNDILELLRRALNTCSMQRVACFQSSSYTWISSELMSGTLRLPSWNNGTCASVSQAGPQTRAIFMVTSARSCPAARANKRCWDLWNVPRCRPQKISGWKITTIHRGSGWWFQIFVIFTPTWGNDPIWLIFFKWVETTN